MFNNYWWCYKWFRINHRNYSKSIILTFVYNNSWCWGGKFWFYELAWWRWNSFILWNFIAIYNSWYSSVRSIQKITKKSWKTCTRSAKRNSKIIDKFFLRSKYSSKFFKICWLTVNCSRKYGEKWDSKLNENN
jgi:hypothetical protein